MILDIIKDKNQQKSFLYLLIRGISVISNYIFSLIVIRFFSKEDYGLYVYGLSIFMLLSVFLKFGVDVHFVKLYSGLDAKAVPWWVQKVEQKVVFFSAVFCLLLAFVIYLFYDDKQQIVPLCLFVLSVPFYVKILLNSGKLRGISNIVEFAFLNIAGRVLFSLILFVVLYYMFIFENAVVIYLSHFLAIFLLLCLSIYWVRKRFLIEKKDDTRIVPKDFFGYNNGLLLKSYITVFFLWGDRFLLSLSSDTAEVASYDIALKIAMIIMIVSEALKSTYAPVFAKNISFPHILKAEIKRSTQISFLLSCLLLLFILLFGKMLLSLFGPEFQSSYWILLIISLGYTISSFFGQADSILEMCGYVKSYLIYYFITILICLGLGVALSIYYGALGMAIGFALGNVFFQGIASLMVKIKMGIKTSFI